MDMLKSNRNKLPQNCDIREVDDLIMSVMKEVRFL